MGGAITGELFRAWVKEQLVQVLRPGDIVVMDNLVIQKVAGVREPIGVAGIHETIRMTGVREAIRAAEAEVLYLPPYSPDLNRIEKAFGVIKEAMRKRKPRTKAECDALCGECPDWFTAAERRNYLRNAGYIKREEN